MAAKPGKPQTEVSSYRLISLLPRNYLGKTPAKKTKINNRKKELLPNSSVWLQKKSVDFGSYNQRNKRKNAGKKKVCISGCSSNL